MDRVTLTIDHTRYRLSAETDLEVLQRSVLRAVRRSGFLTFTPLGFTRVSVLVSRRSSILVETAEEVEAGIDPQERESAADYEFDFPVGRLGQMR